MTVVTATIRSMFEGVQFMLSTGPEFLRVHRGWQCKALWFQEVDSSRRKANTVMTHGAGRWTNRNTCPPSRFVHCTSLLLTATSYDITLLTAHDHPVVTHHTPWHNQILWQPCHDMWQPCCSMTASHGTWQLSWHMTKLCHTTKPCHATWQNYVMWQNHVMAHDRNMRWNVTNLCHNIWQQ